MIIELSIDGHDFRGSVSEAEDTIRRYCDDLRSQLQRLEEQLAQAEEKIAALEGNMNPEDVGAAYRANVAPKAGAGQPTQIERERELSDHLAAACELTLQCEGLQNWGGGDNIYLDALQAALAQHAAARSKE